MYSWIIFIHVLSAFVFAMAHGASTKVIFRVRKEQNPERLSALLELSVANMNVLYLSLLVMMVAGILDGFLGHWWGQGWIWAGLGLLLVIFTAMFFMATMPLGRLREALKPTAGTKAGSKSKITTSMKGEIAGMIEAVKPGGIAAIGYGGLAVIVWLMIFKPF